ncbi:uncharacterized protein LOC104265829 [Ciona intestinalis]
MKGVRSLLNFSLRANRICQLPLHRGVSLRPQHILSNTRPILATTQTRLSSAHQYNAQHDEDGLDFDSLFKDIDPVFDEPRGNERNERSYASNFNFSTADFSQNEDFERDFYSEHPDCANRSQSDIDAFYQSNGITIGGQNVPRPVLDFSELQFSDHIDSKLRRSNFNAPTAIQSTGWPATLSGRDVIGIAQTGSGKTLSFILPALIHIQAQRPLGRGEGPIALVMCPTRELAVQCERVAIQYAGPSIRTACAYGGSSRNIQLDKIGAGCSILVATPGRLMDFLQQGEVNLRRCTYLVLDEADRMLDMGFEPQIRKIVEQIRPDRQVTMWSATWPSEIRQLAKDFISTKSATHIKVGSSDLQASENIQQKFSICHSPEKFKTFKEIVIELKNENKDQISQFPKTLVFCNTKATCDRLSQQLRNAGLRCNAIHGDKSQLQRDSVLNNFRRGRSNILIATDVAARGLDINDIQYVINFDTPNTCTDYIHRIGRTGRAGKPGTSYTLLTEENGAIIKDLISSLEVINHEVDPKLHKMQQWWIQNRTKAKPRPRQQTRRFQNGKLV